MRPRQRTRKRRKNSVLVLTRFAQRMRPTGDDLATASARVAQTGFAIAACLKPQGANRRRVLRTSPSWRYSSKASMPLCRGGAATAACGGPVSAAAPPGAAAIGRLPASTLSEGSRGRIALAVAAPGGPPLLDRPRIAPDRGQISGHCRRFPAAGGIMFPQESRARWPNFPRTAVARAAGIGEYLRGRLAGVEIRLGLRRRIRRRQGGRDDPRHD